ncbi:DNA polymerase I [Thiohalorhabdus sp.]|uniref:DNA polymerase I n=1 Tax=Thiohalorhabdus sp. TaxID=3094134 RepID=UPI002FC327B5
MASTGQNTDSSLIFLVDGSSYIFRAYHALPDLSNSRGLSTGAAYGFAQMVLKLIQDYAPDELGVVFDPKGPTFRVDLFEDYKANRPPMPEDLAEQLPYIHRLAAAFGLPVLVEDGVEADDVIGTLAAQAETLGREVMIVTGDKDMAQLVDDKTLLLDTMKDRLINEDAVRERWGVGPEAVADFLALVGDKVDNIPGVPGVGEKTAAKLLQTYGCLEGLLAHADELTGKVGERIREHAEQLQLNKDLTTIRCGLNLDRTLADLTRGEEATDELRALFRDLEFTSMLRALGNGEEAGPAADYHAVTDEVALTELAEGLAGAEHFAFDTETTTLSAVRADLVGLSFAREAGAAYYVPVGHSGEGSADQLDPERARRALAHALAGGAVKIGQNLKYDLSVLQRAGWAVAGPFEDTMLMSYVLNPTRHSHDMDTLASERLGRTTTKYTEVAGKGAKQVTFDQVPVAEAVTYASEDAEITLALYRDLAPDLAAEPRLEALYRDLELPLMPVLARMERTGVRLDLGLLGELSEELAGEMARTQEQAFALADREFNLNSPKQIQALLFDEQELPVAKRTPKGAPSTNEEVLSQLAEHYPLPARILEYRGLAKLKSTYTDALPKLVNPDTGRVHTSYHQANTATGRLSSAEPNLQNIPVRSEQGRRIRKAFVPAEGWTMVAADYSQIELRLMAHLSGDERLRQAFAEGEDIHAATAAEVFGVDGGEVSSAARRAAKTINFGLIYGMSAWGLAQQLEIGNDEAQAYIDAYFERYPGVRGYMDQAREQVRATGYVETLRGRRIYIPDIQSSNPGLRAAAERQAINAPLQGTAADIIKQAMINVAAWLWDQDLVARLLMQVHDELVLECPPGELERLQNGLPGLMTTGVDDLEVPLEVELGTGANWEEAH